MRLWAHIKEAMLRYPNQVVCENQARMTYEELVIFAERFAQKLAGENCCAILCGSEMAAAMALLSCFASGVTVVPLSLRYGEQHCRKILDLVSPTAIITDMDGQLQVLHLTDSAYIPPREHPALIMCTSGTTGKPKGAMLSEKNVLTNLRDITAYLKIGAEDTILIARPLYHCAVLTGEFLTALCKGTKIRFYSGQFDPKTLLDLIAQYSITVFGGTPTLLGMMARFLRKENANTLKTICVSGECMRAVTGKQIAAAFPGAKIYHVYGLTEACPRVSYLPPEKFHAHPDSVGIPLDSVVLKVVRADGSIAGRNEEGALWIRGGNVMLGYYNAPEQTARVLRGGWLCTGDMVMIDSEGLLYIKGRADDLIIRAGMNIYPQEIEEALRADPRVRQVLVYGIASRYSGMEIGMKIAGDFPDSDAVRQLCLRKLPSFQVPSAIQLVSELPKNGSGKIIRGGNS